MDSAGRSIPVNARNQGPAELRMGATNFVYGKKCSHKSRCHPSVASKWNVVHGVHDCDSTPVLLIHSGLVKTTLDLDSRSWATRRENSTLKSSPCCLPRLPSALVQTGGGCFTSMGPVRLRPTVLLAAVNRDHRVAMTPEPSHNRLCPLSNTRPGVGSGGPDRK